MRENLRMIFHMDSVLFYIQTVVIIRDNGLMIRKRGRGFMFGQKGASKKVSISRISVMAQVNICGQMEVYMKANGVKICKTVMVFLQIKTDLIKANGKTGLSMDRGFIHKLMALYSKVNLKTMSEMDTEG